jgi:hypothetical protein
VSKFSLFSQLTTSHHKHTYMTIEVKSTTLSLYTQIYSNNMPKLFKVGKQKISIHHAVWDIAAV